MPHGLANKHRPKISKEKIKHFLGCCCCQTCSGRACTRGKRGEGERDCKKSLKKNDGAVYPKGAGIPHTHYFVLWSAAAILARPATASARVTAADNNFFKGGTIWLRHLLHFCTKSAQKSLCAIGAQVGGLTIKTPPSTVFKTPPAFSL